MNQKTEQGVVLSTMHRSKGLEWKNVYIIDCNEGIVPPVKGMEERDIEEERRLFYVGITRARENLFLSYVRGSKPRSRFISEAFEKEKKKEMCRHARYGMCLVVKRDNDRITIKSLRDGREYVVHANEIQTGGHDK